MGKNWSIFLISVFLVIIFPSLVMMGRNDEVRVSEQTHEENDNDIYDCQYVLVMDKSGDVASMQLSEYLTGVVLCEMPVTFCDEAIKAQAVVARTYTLRRVEKKTKHDAYDVCTDPGCCQGFMSQNEFLKAGGKTEDIEKVRKAVIDTKGLVLTYKGSLIDATYFSCSGGMTEDAVAVWGKDIPYLKATDSPGEEIATHYTDEVKFSSEDIEKKLSLSPNSLPGAWVENITFTAGGGVDEISICGKAFTGIELRKLLELRSTAFTVEYREGEFVFQTRGFGHRVGMSQYGAEAMALSGASCEEILMHYYSGVKLTQYTQLD